MPEKSCPNRGAFLFLSQAFQTTQLPKTVTSPREKRRDRTLNPRIDSSMLCRELLGGAWLLAKGCETVAMRACEIRAKGVCR